MELINMTFKILEHDTATGKIIERDATAAEIAQKAIDEESLNK
jgi:hypothetical protein